MLKLHFEGFTRECRIMYNLAFSSQNALLDSQKTVDELLVLIRNEIKILKN
jgi:hypothetical protein